MHVRAAQLRWHTVYLANRQWQQLPSLWQLMRLLIISTKNSWPWQRSSWKLKKKNKIDGSVFIELNDKYLRELCPLLGSCIKIHKLVQMSTEPPTVYSPVSVVQLPNFESCTSGVQTISLLMWSPIRLVMCFMLYMLLILIVKYQWRCGIDFCFTYQQLGRISENSNKILSCKWTSYFHYAVYHEKLFVKALF